MFRFFRDRKDNKRAEDLSVIRFGLTAAIVMAAKPFQYAVAEAEITTPEIYSHECFFLSSFLASQFYLAGGPGDDESKSRVLAIFNQKYVVEDIQSAYDISEESIRSFMQQRKVIYASASLSEGEDDESPIVNAAFAMAFFKVICNDNAKAAGFEHLVQGFCDAIYENVEGAIACTEAIR